MLDATPLLSLPKRREGRVVRVEGPPNFRRRIMEMGMVPGTIVSIIDTAPLGDPLQLEVRGARWSMRRAEAAGVWVTENRSEP